MSQAQQTVITDIVTDLKNGIHAPNLLREDGLIARDNGVQDKDVPNFTADCYFDDNQKIVAIEIKTVRPNSGVFKNEKDKILSAKAGLRNAHPSKEIFYYLAFPFDPLSSEETGSDKDAFMNYSVEFRKFFASEEILLADEFWNFLSGDNNTMRQLLDIINAIATPQFMDRYEFLNSSDNRDTDRNRYIQQLTDWNLHSEMNLIQNEVNLLQRIDGQGRMVRKYNQPIFKEGEYNKDRYTALKGLLV